MSSKESGVLPKVNEDEAFEKIRNMQKEYK